MNTSAVTQTIGTNGMIVRTTVIPFGDHFDYSWPLLGVIAVVLIVFGLRDVFFRKNSERKTEV